MRYSAQFSAALWRTYQQHCALNHVFVVIAAGAHLSSPRERARFRIAIHGQSGNSYLEEVAGHFGFSELEFRRIRATNLGPEAGDPYAVLGLLPGASMEEVRQAWRRTAAENHPDRMAQRGAPPEFVAIAEEKTAAINAAYAQIREELSVGAK